MTSRSGFAFFLFALALVAGCDNDMPVALRFRATIGGQDFACGQSYADVGEPPATLVGSDYRFFVSQIRLVDDAGLEVPVKLEQDGKWQVMDLALLDFEDGSGLCSTYGNRDTHTSVTGRVPKAHYKGIHFTLGLPFDENLMDAATAPSPLNLSAMWWNWAGGHQFVRIDTRVGTATGPGYVVHVGNTGCVLSSGVPQMCSHVNTVDVLLTGFDPTTSTVVADLAPILAGTDVSMDAAALGCQSDTDDPDCGPIFSRLGLPFGSAPGGTQQFFTVE